MDSDEVVAGPVSASPRVSRAWSKAQNRYMRNHFPLDGAEAVSRHPLFSGCTPEEIWCRGKALGLHKRLNGGWSRRELGKLRVAYLTGQLDAFREAFPDFSEDDIWLRISSLYAPAPEEGVERVWTEEEDRTLLAWFGKRKTPVTELAKRLHRSIRAIHSRLYGHLDASPDTPKPWSAKDKAYLVQFYGQQDVVAIATQLARSVRSVRNRAERSGLSKRTTG